MALVTYRKEIRIETRAAYLDEVGTLQSPKHEIAATKPLLIDLIVKTSTLNRYQISPKQQGILQEVRALLNAIKANSTNVSATPGTLEFAQGGAFVSEEVSELPFTQTLAWVWWHCAQHQIATPRLQPPTVVPMTSMGQPFRSTSSKHKALPSQPQLTKPDKMEASPEPLNVDIEKCLAVIIFIWDIYLMFYSLPTLRSIRDLKLAIMPTLAGGGILLLPEEVFWPENLNSIWIPRLRRLFGWLCLLLPLGIRYLGWH